MKLEDFKFPIDAYEVKARIAPALLISVPVIVTFWSCFKNEFSSFSEVFKGILSIIIIYSFAIVVRARGKKIEQQLWTDWGGTPSSQIMLWNNTSIGDDLKKLYFQKVRSDLKLPVPTKKDEDLNPDEAMKQIGQAFKRVQGVIRQKDKNGLWSVANADYGFARNLLGSRFIWLFLSLVMTSISAYYFYDQKSNFVLFGLILNIAMTVASIYVGWFVLPEYTKQVAFRYAEHAWESFYNCDVKGNIKTIKKTKI